MAARRECIRSIGDLHDESFSLMLIIVEAVVNGAYAHDVMAAILVFHNNKTAANPV